MWCPRCGSETETGAKFCSQCGLDLSTYHSLWQERGAEAAHEQPPRPETDQAARPDATQSQPARQQPTQPSASQQQVPSHLGWAIASLIFFSTLFAIPAIIYATQVTSKLAYGDMAGARESSRKAKMWCWISFWVAVVSWIFIGLAWGSGMGCALGV